MEFEAWANSNNRINHQMPVNALGKKQMLLGRVTTTREMLLADPDCRLLPLLKDRLWRILTSWFFIFFFFWLRLPLFCHWWLLS
jgi:hypothetical protein